MEYGLIGEKLTHSFSVPIHSFIGDYPYELKEIGREDVADFFAKKDFKAINVTIPYKQTVLPYLDFIDEPARIIGAVNTVVNKNGKLFGYNTDYYGLTDLLKRNLSDFSDLSALILGSGGTSKTANKVLFDLGCKEVFTVSRNPKNNQIGYADAYKLYPDIIINTTPCGMFPNSDGLPINIDCFKNIKLIIDAVYNPWRTDLILNAQKRKIPAESGLYMLVSQAVKASELFFDTKYSGALKDTVFNKMLNMQRNIVLIGMPSCGKSTIGSFLAEKMNRPFIDTDALITEKIGMPISEYFKLNGENKFREIETEIIKEISDKNGFVIATGGGAVLNETNVRRLKHNGMVFFLDRPLNELVPTSDRPLSSNFDNIKKLYFERIDIYNSSCDYKVDVINPEKTSQNIIKEFEK